jgi:betaine-aldehyde dehydrogenase
MSVEAKIDQAAIETLADRIDAILPSHRDLYYAGEWHAPQGGRYAEFFNPGSGASLGQVAEASAADVDSAVEAAAKAYEEWRLVPPAERAKILRRMAGIVREHAEELAMIDAADSGNPVHEMIGDALNAASQLDFFAGLVTEMKGSSVPLGPDSVNFSVREPRGVVARIIPFNHPFMFCAAKTAAPLAAGNTVVVKPPDQAPLSSLRYAELIGDLLPPGVFNVIPGGRDVGAALAQHPSVAMVALIGSVGAGKAVMRAASDTLKPVLLELGGKNALIAMPDSDPDEVAAGVVAGMNFTWCGQSCGSTSRAFIHEDIYEAVLERVAARVKAFKPGLPIDPKTTMGAIISKAQLDRVMGYIDASISEGARLLTGGKRSDDPALAKGNFVEPTVFADVTPAMRIAREEVFGPVLAVFRWKDEREMLRQVNGVEYGLTCSIWTNDVRKAHSLAASVQAGFVWINEVSRHFLGTPFGGYKQSGMGREECIEELISFTQEKHIHVNLKRPARR